VGRPPHRLLHAADRRAHDGERGAAHGLGRRVLPPAQARQRHVERVPPAVGRRLRPQRQRLQRGAALPLRRHLRLGPAVQADGLDPQLGRPHGQHPRGRRQARDGGRSVQRRRVVHLARRGARTRRRARTPSPA
jgi:hypothetical protein